MPDAYADKLIAEGVFKETEPKQIAEQHFEYLNGELANVDSYQPDPYYFRKKWENIKQPASEISVWDTGVDYGLLQHVGKQSVYTPKDFVSSTRFYTD